MHAPGEHLLDAVAIAYACGSHICSGPVQPVWLEVSDVVVCEEVDITEPECSNSRVMPDTDTLLARMDDFSAQYSQEVFTRWWMYWSHVRVWHAHAHAHRRATHAFRVVYEQRISASRVRARIDGNKMSNMRHYRLDQN